MILPAYEVSRIASFNLERCYFCIENLSADPVYILQQEAEKEVFLHHGFKIGQSGLFEMQNCLNPQSKKAWYVYGTSASDLDIRILDI